jgi:hypothetical protein
MLRFRDKQQKSMSVLVAHEKSRVLEKKVRSASIEANEWFEIP